MAAGTNVRFHLLSSSDLLLMDRLLAMFGKAFHEEETYCAARPGREYMERLLASEEFIALAAVKADEVVGGIAAYVLRKFEQERSEVYLYDLAVAEGHRREGIATGLIECLKGIAADRGAYVIFVQADTGIEDAAAIALYSRLGARESVLHFDIAVSASSRKGG
ncbi:MAG: AAC(3)-I family aminoglycoside N-acetyltransferase [Ectothiorhodospiraceae bacterium]|nr:AAC(3)-I family aminoglycoside N-acetyltransferase [Ectothiorhodospiraceae bacterium]MCH8506913.1 AAC(3)-I family aminoglycoside N-acetyltransferase [Ectothiorhodospiraceae bacterium]